MRRVVLSTIGLLALTATGVPAADIPRPAPAYNAPAFVPVFSWTGPYIGINGGYGWGSADWNGVGGNVSADGGLIGLTLGYNWQTGPWVFGLEGDVNWTDLSGRFTNALCPAGCETKNSWLGTARGRLGWAFDRVMPYVTAGLAVGEVETSALGFGSQSETNVGWTAGAGIEAAIAPNWTVKAEYLYVDLGDTSCGAIACGLATNADFNAHILRGGINFKF